MVWAMTYRLTSPLRLSPFHLLIAAWLACFAAFTVHAAEPPPSTPDLEHQQVTVTTTEGLRLSAFVSRPANAEGPLPALFLTQWVSCGSIAPVPDRFSRAERLAWQAGYALIRVDRAGSGDSEGPGCDRLDYETEVGHYREAFDQLAAHSWVNPDQIVIYGSSLGSTTAPLVAQDKPVAGVIVQGAGALTYFERMVNFDRIQLERQPEFAPESFYDAMRKRFSFHTFYLHHRMTPAEIEAYHPRLRGVWETLRGTDAEPHYGRPYDWHWQAAEQDWLAAWTRITAPVMVVFGEYEQFELRHGHRVIVDTLNRLRPGQAQWLEIPKAGHGLRIYPDQFAAFQFEGGENRPELFLDPVSAWLTRLGEP